MDNKKSFPGSGRFDPINSSFKHRIHLQNGKELTGYSKSLLFPETPDKTVLLERVIVRLINNGYLQPDRTKYIEFFLNTPLLPTEQRVITLFPDRYIIGDVQQYIQDHRLYTFITRMYDQIRKGEIVTKSLQHKATVTASNLFDTSRKRFNTEEELHGFVVKQLQSGHPNGQVLNFYHKYRAQWM